MNIFFVAPRVHPNQTPIISGLIEKGHSVFYLVQRTGKYENHAGAKVVELKASKIFSAFQEIIKSTKGIDYAERKSIYYYLPQVNQIRRIFEENKPDVIIVRNRTILSLAALHAAKKYAPRTLLYNQTPEFEDINSQYINPRIKKLVSQLFPSKRMTVVRYKNYPLNGKEYRKDENATFIPFVVRKVNKIKTNYCEDGIVHIFDSGKYRDYKNHFFVVDAANKLKNDGYSDFVVTIQGQVENEEEEAYYQKLANYIESKDVADKVKLLRGVPYNEMENLFLDNDIYVLASKAEVANISIIDAMMYGLLSISTSANGTADYIIPKQTGEIYESGKLDSLCDVIKYYIDHKDMVQTVGKNAHDYAKEHFSFENYYKLLMSLIK